jgi:gamma-glutamylcyclotransferase (GGCT)/AIG2-like uncharacterized protein YtfP
MTENAVTAFFVYGTLKSDQVRGKMWSRTPRSVRVAAVRGVLFDLGAYPAMIPGDDWVAGELWEFDLQDLRPVTERLDSIEGFRAGSTTNLYERVIVQALVADSDGGGQEVLAYTYFYSDHSISKINRRVEESNTFLQRRCRTWPDSQTNLKLVTPDA